MNTVTHLTQKARTPGDPQVQKSGPSSQTPADQLARGLGWFSLALGAVELFAPGALARTLGLQDKEGLLRMYGAREVMAGVQTLSIDKQFGLGSRIAGDVLDIATLLPAVNARNPKHRNAAAALGAVLVVTVLDCLAYNAVSTVHSPKRGIARDYSGRSGLPRGIEASRGLARNQSNVEFARGAA